MDAETAGDPGRIASGGRAPVEDHADVPVGGENAPELRVDLVLLAGHDDEPMPRSTLGHQWTAPRSMGAGASGIGSILTPLIPLCPLAPGGFFQRESEWHVAIAPEPTNLRRPRQCASPAWSGFLQVHQAA